MTPLRILLFGLVSLALAPISMLGLIAYMGALLLLNRRKGISGTAYEPFMGRMMMHDAGEREDVAAKKLSVTLPALPPPIWSLLMGPTMLAGRLSGYFPETFRYPGPRPAGLASAMGIRTEFFDRTRRASLDTAEQVVILGAGWGTRAYGILREWGHPVFEVDARPTQQAKLAALQKAGIDSSHVTFVEVTMYLEEEAITDTLRTVSSFPSGSTLAFDYFARQLVKAEPPLRLLGMVATASIRWFYGENIMFGFDMEPPAKDTIAARLSEHDLDLLDYEILSGEEKGKIAIYGFALASPMG
ncbi:MAG: class I SAM-dependent methyltransferase [Gemmatimonadetes bacterium]|nr:class I SAM-dependent methyltransferase [Gemmatimonadota bacterium]